MDVRFDRVVKMGKLLRTVMQDRAEHREGEANVYMDKRLGSKTTYLAHALSNLEDEMTTDNTVVVKNMEIEPRALLHMSADDTKQVVDDLLRYGHTPHLPFMFVAQEVERDTKVFQTRISEYVEGDYMSTIIKHEPLPVILTWIFQLLMNVVALSQLSIVHEEIRLDKIVVTSITGTIVYMYNGREYYATGRLPILTDCSFISIPQQTTPGQVQALLHKFIARGLPATDVETPQLHWTLDAIQLVDAFVDRLTVTRDVPPYILGELLRLRTIIIDAGSLPELIEFIYTSEFYDEAGYFSLSRTEPNQKVEVFDLDLASSPSVYLKGLVHQDRIDVPLAKHHTDEFFYRLFQTPIPDEELLSWSELWGMDLQKGRNLLKVVRLLFLHYVTRLYHGIVDRFTYCVWGTIPSGREDNTTAKFLLSCRLTLLGIIDKDFSPDIGLAADSDVLAISPERSGEWASFEFYVARLLTRLGQTDGDGLFSMFLVSFLGTMLGVDESNPNGVTWNDVLEFAGSPEFHKTINLPQFYDMTKYPSDLGVETIVDGLTRENRLPRKELREIDAFIAKENRTREVIA